MSRAIRSFSLVAFTGLLASLHGCACGPQPPGAACDPNAEEACQEGSVCVAVDDAHQCRIAAGESCDAEAEEAHCVDGTSCFPVSDDEGECRVAEGNGCEPANEHCAPGLVCEEVDGGEAPNECHLPLLFEGSVKDAADESPIEGALVLALDARSGPVTDVATTDVSGNYVLQVPARRDAEGRPLDEQFTLRASAQDYQPFPGGVRSALPIDPSLATEEDRGWVIVGGLVDVALIALPDDEQGLPAISGHVKAAGKSGGVLVVAEGAAAAPGAISDRSGAYTLFNVPAGDYTVRGYRAGLQLVPEEVTVDDESLTGVDLSPSDAALATVSGSIQGVDGVGGRPTSVVLVVESTFNDVTERGEVPFGLRTDKNITGEWSIGEVPVGRYVVLAAYENDELVRDPDTGIAGTELLTVDVAEGASVEAGSFKVTVALAIVSPGADAPEAVTDPPTLTWVDDSSEKEYRVVVYDSFGNLTWETSIPSVNGQNASVQYGGPPLEAGVYYQFRATSYREAGGVSTPASRTEDLRGVFYLAE